MIYYRVALRGSQLASWRWKSSPLTSLDGVLGWLHLYRSVPREHIRVFLFTSPEQMETMLRRENQGLLSTCTGYLDHPFKKCPVRRRKIFIPCLQTQEGWRTIRSRQQHIHARTTILSRDGEATFMADVFTSLQRLKDGCLHALLPGFSHWTRPLRTSLPLSTLTDLGRSKSELIAENALLRQQLIILKRQVKRPTFTKTDRLPLILLARLVRTWQQAHITRATRHLAMLASGALSLVMEAQVQGSCLQAQGRLRNHRLDQADGQGQSALGC